MYLEDNYRRTTRSHQEWGLRNQRPRLRRACSPLLLAGPGSLWHCKIGTPTVHSEACSARLSSSHKSCPPPS
eukprot:1518177-Amphidinium_carterae.1